MEKIKVPKPAKMEAGSKDLKRVKEKLSKIKIDENFITERINQLVNEGYDEEEAKNVAGKEAMIKTDNDRIALYKENPDLKDSEEMIQKILIKRDSNQREINEILKTRTEKKEVKSNRQMVRLAEEKLRNLSVDLSMVKKEKEDLLQGGYPFDFSEKLSVLNGEIRLLQNKIQIIIDNPKIENGVKLRKSIEDKLKKFEGERNSLLTSKPEIAKIENKNKNLHTKEENVVDEYDEANISEDIKNSISKKVTKFKTEKVYKKIDWSKLNPASWFKNYKKKEVNTGNQESDEKDLKRKIILSSTGAAPVFYEDTKDVKKQEDIDTEKIIDEKIKIEKEKRKMFLSHTGAAPAFYEDKVEAGENNESLGLKLEEILANKEKATLAKLNESRFRSTALKTIGAVENFGKNEAGPTGISKRLFKMGINLALIGLISSLAVQKLAEADIGTATALSGGVFSKLVVKMGFGLGIGASMEIGGGKIPPKVRKFIPYIMGVGGITAATLLSGGLAGVAAGASFGIGLASQKWLKGRFTDEKIEARKIEMIKEFNQKIEKNGFDINKIKQYEDEYEKIIKKFENQKIWGKLSDGAAKLTLGTLVSGLTLEASGFARDFAQGDNFAEFKEDVSEKLKEVKESGEDLYDKAKDILGIGEDEREMNQNIDKTLQEDIAKAQQDGENAINKEMEDVLKKENDALTKEVNNPISKEQLEINKDIDKTLQEDIAKMEKEGEEAINKEIENKTELDKAISETKNPDIKTVSAEANGGQGAISTLRELQQNLKEEYSGVEKLPENVAHIINTDPHDLAKEYGLYRPGEDAESAKVFVGDKMSFNKETGEVVFTHVRGGEDILQQGVEYKGGMFDSGRIGTVSENTAGSADPFANSESIPGNGEAGSDFEKNNPQVNPFANSEDIPSSFLDTHPQVPPQTIEVDMTKDGVTEELKNTNDFNKEEVQGGGEQTKETEIQSDNRDLSPRELRQVDRVFDRNIDELFPKKQDMVLWDKFKGSNAADFYYRDPSVIEPQYESLHSYLHKINEVTGLEPKEGPFFTEQESNAEYIQRGLEKAVLLGKLDQVKL